MRKQRSIKQVPRGDGWANQVTGIGEFARDKSMQAGFYSRRVPQATAEELWEGDDIAARAVEKVPSEMFREGFCIQVEGDKDLSEEMDARVRDLKLVEIATRAIEYKRAFGGAGILLGVNDGGGSLDSPMPESFFSLDYLTLYTPSELVPRSYFTEPARYGDIALYDLVPLWIPPGAAATAYQQIDSSRIVRSEGPSVSKRRMLSAGRGWGESIFTRMAQVISNFQQGWQGLGILLQDFATPVLKVENLSSILASKQGDGQSLQARLAALEMCRSLARVAIIGKNEEYERKPIQLSGLSDALDKLCVRLAGCLDMPVSLLMGQSPAGLNATGDAELRWFLQQVRAMQRREAVPLLRPIVRAMFLDKVNGPGKEPENWDIRWPSLWQPTEKETAEVRKLVAETDKIYLDAGVLDAETVAEQRFGGDEWSMETHVDMEDWKKMAEQAAADEQALEEAKAAAAVATGKPDETA